MVALNWLTCASKSIPIVSWFTGTREVARSVSAAGISATSSVVYCTLVDICVITDIDIVNINKTKKRERLKTVNVGY